MYKQTLLSALLASSFSLSSIAAATTAMPDLKDATTQLEQTAIKFICNSKTEGNTTKERILGITDQTCPKFPFARTSENNAQQIAIKSSTLSEFDPWFFQDNSDLKRISFESSTIGGFEVFEGHKFASNCTNITSVSFKDAEGVTLDDFIRKYASKTLLERIMSRKCELIFSPPADGVTMMNFTTKAKVPTLEQNAIHLLIHSSRILETIAAEEKAAAKAAEEKAANSAEKKSRGWVSTLTFGLLGD